MKSWIHLSRGIVPRQAHVGLKELGGLKEDEIGRAAFGGRVAELYRRNEPTNWTRIEGNLRPSDVDGYELVPTDMNDPAGNPLQLFYNTDGSVWVSRRSAEMPFYARNADGDEVHFVHQGVGIFDTEFGPIPYEPGDYVVIPKGVTYRIVPEGTENYFFIVETVGEIGFADIGPIGRHAPFDPTLLFVPTPREEKSEGSKEAGREWVVRIKACNEYTSVYYPFDPNDVAGWKGDLFPFKINIRDYRSIVGDRIHIMPTAAGIFSAPGFIICNFLPRPAETDPEAERVPPYHRNVDYDELMFAHGDKVLNAKINPASITHLPQCLHHGLPESLSNQIRKNWKKDDYFDQKLIAVDTLKPLKVAPIVRELSRAMDQIRGAKSS